MILLPFESKNQFFYLLYNEPDVFMEWVEKYGVPAEFKVGSTKHWLRKINQMEPNRNRKAAEDYKGWEIKDYSDLSPIELLSISGLEYEGDQDAWDYFMPSDWPHVKAFENYNCELRKKLKAHSSHKPDKKHLTKEEIAQAHSIWYKNKQNISYETWLKYFNVWYVHDSKEWHWNYSDFWEDLAEIVEVEDYDKNRPMSVRTKELYDVWLNGKLYNPLPSIVAAPQDAKVGSDCGGVMLAGYHRVAYKLDSNEPVSIVYWNVKENAEMLEEGTFKAEGGLLGDTELTKKEIKTIMWYPLVIGFLGGTLATVAGNILSALYLKRKHGLWADKE